MPTNRTATAKWRRVRDQVRTEARERGLTNCPLCNVYLNWDQGRTPRSVEIDHILPVARGGSDDPSGLRAICRKCNQQMGGALTKRKAQPVIKTVDIDPDW